MPAARILRKKLAFKRSNLMVKPPSKMMRMRPMYPKIMKVSCLSVSKILPTGVPYRIPSRICPMRPARIILLKTHPRDDRKKKNDINMRWLTISGSSY